MAMPVKNFAKGVLSTGYTSADTSIVLTTGHGSRFPQTFPYNAVWWNATDYPDPADDPDVEIVSVTAGTGDTKTLTRAQESTSASNKNISGKVYKLEQSITAAMWAEIQTFAPSQTFRNLTMQTHPDQDIAHKTVRLLHADSIVMQDGQEIATWDDLNAALDTNGVGGLDTGGEQVSTWYELHAIYNGTAKGLMLHRAKQYNGDQVSTAGEDASQGLRSAVDNSTVRIGQGFTTIQAGLVPFIDVKVIKTGVPTGQFWIQIETNSGAVPSNTVLATSHKLDVSRITTTATWVRMRFETPVSLSAATLYHITMHGNYTISAANFISWRMDGSAAAYAGGSKALYDSDTSTWTQDTDDDMMFRFWNILNDTAVTMPAGYTQRSLVGYAYNDSAGNLKHFFQKDHAVLCGYDDAWQIAAYTGTTPDVIDLFAFIPPTPVELMLALYNGTGCNIAVGGLECTDLSTTATDERLGIIRSTLAAAATGAISGLCLDQYQGLMAAVSAGTLNMYVSRFSW